MKFDEFQTLSGLVPVRSQALTQTQSYFDHIFIVPWCEAQLDRLYQAYRGLDEGIRGAVSGTFVFQYLSWPAGNPSMYGFSRYIGPPEHGEEKPVLGNYIGIRAELLHKNILESIAIDYETLGNHSKCLNLNPLELVIMHEATHCFASRLRLGSCKFAPGEHMWKNVVEDCCPKTVKPRNPPRIIHISKLTQMYPPEERSEEDFVECLLCWLFCPRS